MRFSKSPVVNISLGISAGVLLLACIMGCDSPPWSRFVVANESKSAIIVRFYTPYAKMASPYLYSAAEWKADRHFSSGNPPETFKINEEENYIEVIVAPAGAVEIDRARYPDLESDIEGYLLIDRLDIHGDSGDISWSGRREIFNQLHKEKDSIFDDSFGQSPRFVYYYK